ncbi:hypothetical protein FIBSPDRAFT_1035296 [Athelia psychrophila]|uniref:Uncharacterized protein n=1 Tax=Athelia psychrophila TaxID=1759441 RepID=A0A166WXB5_9AGAM|nr:hypothetical protein FIBSPDRAFT_1035296 [Fibularhizoctonia sp. CBS 109695]
MDLSQLVHGPALQYSRNSRSITPLTPYDLDSRNDSSSSVPSSPMLVTPFASSSPPGQTYFPRSRRMSSQTAASDYSEPYEDISPAWGLHSHPNMGRPIKALYATMPPRHHAYSSEGPSWASEIDDERVGGSQEYTAPDSTDDEDDAENTCHSRFALSSERGRWKSSPIPIKTYSRALPMTSSSAIIPSPKRGTKRNCVRKVIDKSDSRKTVEKPTFPVAEANAPSTSAPRTPTRAARMSSPLPPSSPPMSPESVAQAMPEDEIDYTTEEDMLIDDDELPHLPSSQISKTKISSLLNPLTDLSDSEDEPDDDSSLIPPIATLDFSSAFAQSISRLSSPTYSRRQTPIPEATAPACIVPMPTPEATPAPPELAVEVAKREPTPMLSISTPISEIEIETAQPTVDVKLVSEPPAEKQPLENKLNTLNTPHAAPEQAMVGTPSSHVPTAAVVPALDMLAVEVEEMEVKVDSEPLTLLDLCSAESPVEFPVICSPPAVEASLVHQDLPESSVESLVISSPPVVEALLVHQDLPVTSPSPPAPTISIPSSSPLSECQALSRASTPLPSLPSCEILAVAVAELEAAIETPLACPMERPASPMIVDTPLPVKATSKKASAKSESATVKPAKRRATQPKASSSKPTLPAEKAAPVVAISRPRTVSAKRKSKQDVDGDEEPAKKRAKAPVQNGSASTKVAVDAPMAEASDAVHDPPKARKTSKSDPKPKSRAKKTKRAGSPAPVPGMTPTRIAELQGMIIESFAVSRASSLPASALYATMANNRPSIKDEHAKAAWLGIIEAALGAGESGCGMFGKIESSFKDDSDRALEAKWFYVPERDADQERATLISSMMPRAAKRTETKKYKQYYFQPLDKISRWDPEDDL